MGASKALKGRPEGRGPSGTRWAQHYVFAADEWLTQSYASLNIIVDQFEEMLSEDLDISVDFRSVVPRTP